MPREDEGNKVQTGTSDADRSNLAGVNGMGQMETDFSGYLNSI